MQLIYRGIAYQSITAVASAKQQTNLPDRETFARLPKAENYKIADIRVLKYRGIDFIKILNY